GGRRGGGGGGGGGGGAAGGGGGGAAGTPGGTPGRSGGSGGPNRKTTTSGGRTTAGSPPTRNRSGPRRPSPGTRGWLQGLLLGADSSLAGSPGGGEGVEVVETCQRCGGPRLARRLRHLSGLCRIVRGGKPPHGYVPRALGIGGGDDVPFLYCLDCGQIRGTFPLPPSGIEEGHD